MTDGASHTDSNGLHPAPDQSSKSEHEKCKRIQSGGRNLVVCIDGTANKFGSTNTNVIELYRRLVKDDTQITYYNSGIGTLASPSYISYGFVWRAIDHLIDRAIGWNFEKGVFKAYGWLADNYRPNDRIFLFGFSRGAYQVRTLAAMIHEVGLLRTGNREQIPFAYELYARGSVDRITSMIYTILFFALLWLAITTFYPFSVSLLLLLFWIVGGRLFLNAAARLGRSRFAHHHGSHANAEWIDPLTRRYKDIFSQNARVHFLGVWDTVSSLGHLRSTDLPNTVDGEDHVCVFRHALALNEHRVKFLPEYRYGGASSVNEDTPALTIPKVKETWFSGSHADIGGKTDISLESFQNNPTLRWMAYEAAASGLFVDLTDLHDRPPSPKTPRKSLKGVFWRVMEFLPIEHRSYKDRDSLTIKPHCGKSRVWVKGQLVHRSVEKPPHGLDNLDAEPEDGLFGLVRRRMACADCDR